MGKKLYDKRCFWHINFAHRGLHDLRKQIPENSLAAFRAAANAGYGAELDVQLSKDGKVVVFHDDDLKRACGIDAPVSDYTYEELSEMSLFGTEETIPLFSDVLDVFRDRDCPLIVELKNGKRNDELCEKTYALLKAYPGVYCIESFNPFIVNWFRKHAPEVFRGQLAEGPDGYKGAVPRFAAYVLAGCWLSFLNKPDFIAYRLGHRPGRVLRMKEKGMLLFAWTSHSLETDTEENDAIIFEHYLPPVKY